MNHCTIEVSQIVIAKVVIIDKVPLTTGIFMTPTVSFAWEVNPLWMSEFISHEVQITTIDGGGCQKSYHLMKCNTTISHEVFIAFLEMPIHIGINQPEDNGLVAHQCLIMTLCIRNRFLVSTTIGQFPEHRRWFPVLVLKFLDSFNPIIGDIHRHTIVEPISTIFERCCQTWHTTHLLSNCDGTWMHFMNQLIG